MNLKLSDKDIREGDALAAEVGYPESVNLWNEWARENAENLLTDLATAKERIEGLEADNEALVERVEELEAE